MLENDERNILLKMLVDCEEDIRKMQQAAREFEADSLRRRSKRDFCQWHPVLAGTVVGTLGGWAIAMLVWFCFF